MTADTVLLIIDVQLGLFEDKYQLYNTEPLLNTLSTLISQARQSGTPLIYIQHTGSGLEPGMPGWQIHPDIAPAEGELVVHKTHPDSFWDTTLQEELHKLGVKNLVIAGLQTEYCVDTTCRRANSLGYSVTLVADGHSTFDNRHLKAPQIIAHHNETLNGSFLTVRPADSIRFA
jgi:nicotinamidase-related amidase